MFFFFDLDFNDKAVLHVLVALLRELHTNFTSHQAFFLIIIPLEVLEVLVLDEGDLREGQDGGIELTTWMRAPMTFSLMSKPPKMDKLSRKTSFWSLLRL